MGSDLGGNIGRARSEGFVQLALPEEELAAFPDDWNFIDLSEAINRPRLQPNIRGGRSRAGLFGSGVSGSGPSSPLGSASTTVTVITSDSRPAWELPRPALPCAPRACRRSPVRLPLAHPGTVGGCRRAHARRAVKCAAIKCRGSIGNTTKGTADTLGTA